MARKINGLGFNLALGDLDIRVMKFSLNINDDSGVAMRDGRPDGSLLGQVTGDGEIEVDVTDFKLIIAAAKEAGSFQDLPAFDINAFGSIAGSNEELKIEAFECQLKLSSLLDVDKTGSSNDQTTITIPYDVTGQDFVSIDGVPYAKKLS